MNLKQSLVYVDLLALSNFILNNSCSFMSFRLYSKLQSCLSHFPLIGIRLMCATPPSSSNIRLSSAIHIRMKNGGNGYTVA